MLTSHIEIIPSLLDNKGRLFTIFGMTRMWLLFFGDLSFYRILVDVILFY